MLRTSWGPATYSAGAVACGAADDSTMSSVVMSTMSEPAGRARHPETSPLRIALMTERNAKLSGLAIEVRPFDPEGPGRIAHLPRVLAQHAGDELALERPARVAQAAGRACRRAIELDLAEHVFLPDDPAAGRGQPIDQPGELGGIAAPRQRAEHGQRGGREPAAAIACRKHRSGDRGHIVAPLTEGGDLDDDREPPDQVLAETGIEAPGGRGDDTNVERDRCRAPGQADLTVPQEAGQTLLKRGGEFVQVGQEQHPAARTNEGAGHRQGVEIAG